MSVFVTTRHIKTCLTHIFIYDASVPSFSGNLLLAPPPYALLPVVPAAGDMIYFGVAANTNMDAPLWNIILELVAGSDLTTISWEYSRAGGFTAFASGPYLTGINHLQQNGVISINWRDTSYFVNPANQTINGIDAWWIRANITAVGGAPTPPIQINRHVYTCNWGHIDINTEDTELGELDHEALIELQTYGMIGAEHIIGLRSLDRGEDFSAYINLTDKLGHFPPGISIQTTGGVTFISHQKYSPSGRSINYLTPGGTNNAFAIVLDSSISNQYYGKYHAYLCCVSDAAAARPYTYIAIAYNDIANIVYTSKAGTFYSNDNILAIDFGEIFIGGNLLESDLSTVYLIIMIDSDVGHDYIYTQLVLIPSDECVLDIKFTDNYMVGEYAFYGYDNARIGKFDRLSFPKEAITNVRESGTDDELRCWYTNYIDNLRIHKNANQRLWIFEKTHCDYSNRMDYFPYHHHLYKPHIEIAKRYLSMRGER